MRHRITYVHLNEPKSPVKKVNSTYVELEPELTYAREDKYTLDAEALSHVSAIRIHICRGAETGSFDLISPFSYSYQTGMHVYAVPIGRAGPDDESLFYEQLNSVLLLVLGIQVPAQEWILSLNSFYFHTSMEIEPKFLEIPLFPHAWLALDYYYSDSKLTVSALATDLQDLSVHKKLDEYTEVGIFKILDKSSRDDLILLGARVIFDNASNDSGAGSGPDSADEKVVHKTMFHVKPRHRHVGEFAEISFRPNGLHPVVTIDKIPSVPADDDVLDCKLFSYFTMEKSVFLDPFQVPDLLNIVANYGVTNLELPEYSVPQWGNEVLMEVKQRRADRTYITLATHTSVSVDHPVLFYACDASNDAYLLKNSPFDNKKYIGGSFEKFFTDDTIFYHVLNRGTSDILIPNASGNANHVNLVTFGALLLGLYMVLSKAYEKFAAGTPKAAPAKKND
ncbi:hypothetical protein HF325_006648 [Metschnikowia pulcherrima]|uniref:Protein PBN1 n=1 Tax=Metschnikowia pulcherrima TaxID=27326 RepID=A0A8H7GM77_9ASCO|nr:hypothetical protein HF325_006648 [Metschnikowia pulcherrima]